MGAGNSAGKSPPAVIHFAPETGRSGQVSEWLKEPVSKTGKGQPLRGFESLPVRCSSAVPFLTPSRLSLSTHSTSGKIWFAVPLKAG